MATGHREKLNNLNRSVIAAKQTWSFHMRDDICFGECRAWYHCCGKTSCQQMTPGYRVDDGWCFCFHGASIVEQENWGNAVYALPAIILPWVRRLLPTSFLRAVVPIAIITVGTFANCRLVSVLVRWVF